MKTNSLYLLLILVTLSIGSCKEPRKELMPSLAETFQKTDKKPFGGFVAFNRIKELLDSRFIETNEDPFDEAWKNMHNYSSSTKHSLYILLTRNLITSYSEADAMIDYVSDGNDLFIAADYMSVNFLKKIDCWTERDSEIVTELAGNMKQTFVKILNNDLPGDSYRYYYYPFYNSFSHFDSSSTKILGLNELGKPNFIVLFIGKGRLYLNSAPRAFSNYFLLKGNNYKYLENAVSYLRPDPKNIFWDEFYKKQDVRRKHSSGGKASGSNSGDQNDQSRSDFSSFNVINSNPALRAAFWLALILLLLYVLFNMKRKQRIIEEKLPNTNTTVVFTETVGRLYLQKRNNKNIAEKMITYFYEHIRNNYFLNTTKINSEFITSLSRKSGVPDDITTKLFKTISLVHDRIDLDDSELLSLNEQIQNFYKNKY